jgi:nucleoside-diphosphate-sugar epimerase
LRKCLRGETITIEGSGEQTRDMNYVDNTVSGVLLAMKHGQPGEIYNIGNGYSPSINAVVEMCVEATGKQPPIEHTAPRGGEEGRLDIDISKAREQLGYEPEIPLKLGIERTLHWMLENEGAA